MKVIRKQYYDDGREPTTTYDDAPRTISRAEQVQTGLVKRNYTPAEITLATDTRSADLSPKQQAVMAASQQMIGGALAMPTQASSHARQDDTAVVVAHAHNVASKPKLLVAGFVFAMLALGVTLFWQLGKSEFMLIAIICGVMWGAVAMLILQRDRAVALHHSAPGVEHHKIDAQADVQKTAVQSWETIMLAMIKSEDGEQ